MTRKMTRKERREQAEARSADRKVKWLELLNKGVSEGESYPKALARVNSSVSFDMANNAQQREEIRQSWAEFQNHQLAELAAVMGDKEEETRLSPEQVEHWRGVMYSMFGPCAFLLSAEDIQRIRDNMQKQLTSPTKY